MRKITFIIDNVSHKGGTERVLSNLVSLLSPLYELKICSIERGVDNGFLSNYDCDNIIFSTGVNRFIRLVNIIRYINKESFDTVIIISMGRLSLEMNFLLKVFKCKAKVISCDHVGIETFSLPKRLMKLISYSFADQIVVLTDNDKEYIKKRNPVIKNITTIRNMSSFSKLDINLSETFFRRDKSVLAVGRLVKQKNFGVLIKLWAKIPNDIKSGWILKIAGDGELSNTLNSLIMNSGLENEIFLIGNVSDMSEEYNKASFLCMTSLYEGLPMALIEAKDFGLPVIAFNCKTGPKEIINGDGYLINEFDEENYLTSLIELLQSESIRYEMGVKALINRRDFSDDKIKTEWLKII